MATLPADPYENDPFFGPHCREHPLGCPHPDQPEIFPPVVARAVSGRLDMAPPAPVADPLPPTRHEAIREETRLRRRRTSR